MHREAPAPRPPRTQPSVPEGSPGVDGPPRAGPRDARRVLVDRYVLTRPCAAGGMGKVWLAHDSVLRRDVAVKELRADAPGPPGSSPERSAQPLLEARAAAAVNHPCAVAVHDVVEDDGRLWVVMQYVDGRALSEVLTRARRLTPAVTAHVGLCLLDALHTAHRSGVVHCDVKPGNVLVSRDGDVVLIDFGIASNGGARCVDATGVVVGSPGYMAPEVLRGEPASPASDLWSLGATLYACVEGTVPLHLADVLAGDPDPRPRPPRRASGLTPLLRGLLDVDPGTRPSARDARLALAVPAGARATLSRLVAEGR